MRRGRWSWRGLRVGVIAACGVLLLVCVLSMRAKYTWFNCGNSTNLQCYWGLFQGKLDIVWWHYTSPMAAQPSEPAVWFADVRITVKQRGQWLPLLYHAPGGALIIVPMWLPAVAALAAAGWAGSPWWFMPLRRWLRRRRRLCLQCGYDRVGLAPQDRCPECGCLGDARGSSAVYGEDRLRDTFERWAAAGLFVLVRCVDGAEIVYRPWAVWRDTDGTGPIWVAVGLARDPATGRERSAALRLDKIRDARLLAKQPRQREVT